MIPFKKETKEYQVEVWMGEKSKMKIEEYFIHRNAQLTAYLHSSNEENENSHTYPAILILPGGGFYVCSEREAEPVAMTFFAHGFQAFVLRYTTISVKKNAVIEDPMEDVQEALKIIENNKTRFGIASHQLAMLGFSGGGHLAAASTVYGPRKPDCLLLGYPGIVHSELRALECPDIIERVDAATPPCFMFSTADDEVTPPEHVLTFASALAKHGVKMEVHMFTHGVHGLSLGTKMTANMNPEFINERFAQWVPLSLQWLKELWKDRLIS